MFWDVQSRPCWVHGGCKYYPVLTLVGSVLSFLAGFISHSVLLFWMVQPRAAQTLRCFPVMQGTWEDAGSEPADQG